MSWLLDLGNTRAKWARYGNDGRDGPVQALAHDAPGFADRLADALGPAAPGARVWLASVADAALTGETTRRLESAGYACERVRTRAHALGVRIAYAEPARLGVDRFLALVAAHARGDGPWLCVSVGSALTVDLLLADGVHAGGLIAPSPAHMRRALAERFPVLATDAGDATLDWAGDTPDAVEAGCVAAAAGLVERAYRLATQRAQAAPTVLVTGGEADVVRAALPFASIASEAPVLDGLARLAREGGR
jgi:type III pantothenate kinase